MIQFLVSYLWHGLIGWIGVAGLALAVSAYVFFTSPSAGVRHICVLVATVCVCVMFLYPKAFHDGANHVKVQWAAAEQKMRALGDAARADALADAARGVRDPFDSDSK